MTMTGGNATLNAQITVQVWQQSGTCTASTTPDAATVTSGTLASPPALHSSIVSIASGASRTYCVRTTLKKSYTAPRIAITTTPTVTVTGKIGSAWTTSATGTFTQSAKTIAYRVYQDTYPVNSGGVRCMYLESAAVTKPNCVMNADSRLLFTPVDGGYRIASEANPTKFVALAGTTVGYVTTADDDSLWVLAPHTTGRFLLQNVLNPNRCLSAPYLGSSGTATLVSAICDSTLDPATNTFRDQTWLFEATP